MAKSEFLECLKYFTAYIKNHIGQAVKKIEEGRGMFDHRREEAGSIGRVFDDYYKLHNIDREPYAGIEPGVGIAELRMDGAGENTSAALKEHCDIEGIARELSNAHTPHQNGFAERAIGILWEGCQALRIAAGLPVKYWPYALIAFTHIRNRLPKFSPGPFTNRRSTPNALRDLAPDRCPVRSAHRLLSTIRLPLLGTHNRSPHEG